MATQYLTNSAYALERMIALVRQFGDEPYVEEKYQDADILLQIETSFQEVLADVNESSDAPILCRHSISLSSTTPFYMLPPGVEQILRIAKMDSATGSPLWATVPKGPTCPGFRLEGRALVLEPYWQTTSETVEILYIPNGDLRLHYGLAGAVVNSTTSSTVVLDDSPTMGTFDTRENAYVGAVFRSTGASSGIVERTITAYDRATKIATVRPAFPDTYPASAGYEVLPLYGRLVESAVAAKVARDLLRVNGDEKRANLVNLIYLGNRRTVRRQLARMQNIVGDQFEHRTPSWR